MTGAMLAEAWHAMGANRLRTFLTMLGMVIGVGAVILMLAIGRGAQFQVEQSIASMGSNLFIILSGSSTAGGVRLGGGAAPTLTLGDAQAIAELPTIAAVAPTVPGGAQIVYGQNNWGTQVLGTTPSYLDVRDWRIEAGYPFTDSDVRSATRVALVGQTVAKNLFGEEEPVGKTIRIKQSPYLVIGLLAAKGQSLDGRDQDDTILVPVTTAQRKLFGTQFQGTVRFIMAQATAPEAMAGTERAINQLLRQRHRLQEGTDSDFTVRNLAAVANTAAETARIMSLMLGAIGIRMAVGARQRDILLQFLLEAIIISVVGCLVGVILGVGGAVLANKITGTAVVITLSSVVMAFLVAAGVGVFFGFYPANKAARLEPIDALRYQ
ncbi:MAG: ABC transporter permease [Proteobacteria bacterium]|nr:ABC transporter permease [Pseudomonadota bacterium]